MLIPNESLFLKRTSQLFRNHKARAARDHLRLGYTLEELRTKARSAVCCPYCRCVLATDNLSADHAMPVARKTDCFTWTLLNTTFTCRKCNELKSALTHAEFSSLMTVVLAMPPQAQANVFSRLRAGAVRIYAKGKR